LDSVEIVTGGARAIRGTSARRTLAWLALFFAGVLTAGGAAGRFMWPRSLWRPSVAAIGAGLVAASALVALRFAPMPDTPQLALVAWLVALGVMAAAAASIVTSHLGAGLDTARPGLLAFTILAALVVAVMFSDAWRHGWVLSQAGLLYQFAPWSLHAPPGPRPPANPLLGDVPMVFYPFLAHTVDSLRQGHIPLWTTAIFSGHPFFASFQSALLSPFTLLALVAPLPEATVIIAVARLLVGGIGMFVFVRALGLGRRAATFAGLACLLNPFSVVWLEHPVSAVSAWLPWVLWAVERSVQRPGAGRAAVLSAVSALALLAGHPETCLKVFLLAGAWGLCRAVTSSHRWRALLTLAAGSALGVAATAVQLVPFVEYLRQSRAYLGRLHWGANPFVAPALTAVTALVPDFFGNPVDGSYLPVQNRFGHDTNYCEQQIYPSVVIWLLAATGLVARWRDGRAWFFAAAGVTGALLKYGTPILADAALFVPLLNMTAQSRFGMVVIASAIVLAAFGVEALVRHGSGAGRADSPPHPSLLWLPAVVTALLAGGAVAVCLAWCAPMLARVGQFDRTLAACVSAGLFGAGTLMLVWARVGRRLSPQVFAVCVSLLLVIDLLGFGRGFHPMVPAALVYPRVPEIDAITRDPGLFRVIGVGSHLIPNSALAYGLQDPRGYDGMWPARYCDLLDAGLGGLTIFHQTVRMEDPKLLDLLNVKYVIAPPDVRLPAGRYTRIATGPSAVYRNERALPRAFLADRYLVRDGNPARRILRDGSEDPRHVVLLEHELPADERPEDGAAAAGSVRVTDYRDTFVEIAADSPRRSVLVLTDAYYPGWQATVDGTPITIHRANFAFRAVAMPAGRHVVRFQYLPRSVTVGFSVSLAALVAIVGLVVVGRRQGRPPKTSPAPRPTGDADGMRTANPAVEESARPALPQNLAQRPPVDLTILVFTEGRAMSTAVSGALGLQAAEIARRLGIHHEIVVAASEGTADSRRDAGLTREAPGGIREDVDAVPQAGAEASAREVRSSLATLGRALQFGLDASGGHFVLTVDASGTLDPDVVARMWARRHDGGVVVAVRPVDRATDTSDFWPRRLRWVVGAIVRRGLSLQLTDPACAFRLYRRDALESLHLDATGPSAQVEALVRINAEGWEIIEVPHAGGGTAECGSVARLLAVAVDLVREFPRLWRLRNSPFSADYDDRAFDSLIPLQRYWQRTRHARVTEFLGNPDRVLDVGCGSSRIILGLPRAVGVDIQLKKLRRVQRAARRLVQASLTRLPLRDGSFDAVICSQVIEHVASSDVDWSEFARVLAPGGVFIVGTPDYATLTWRLLEWAYLRVHPRGYSTGHVNRYTAERLRRELECAGFEVTGHAYVGGGELIVRATKILARA
jgi:SAM-dependent methyltransferase